MRHSHDSINYPDVLLPTFATPAQHPVSAPVVDISVLYSREVYASPMQHSQTMEQDSIRASSLCVSAATAGNLFSVQSESDSVLVDVPAGGDWLRVALGGAARSELFQAAILDSVERDLLVIWVLALVALVSFYSSEASVCLVSLRLW